MKPKIIIRYCPKCNWLPRAAWVAQEILQTFSDHLEGVVLMPADPGTFDVSVGTDKIYDRRLTDAPLDPVAMKRAIRDLVAPDLTLGHSEKKNL